MNRTTFAAFVLATLVAAATPARADVPPWAAGVTDGQKAHAQKLLDAGNALFLDKKYAEALEAYRQAVAVWDHPAIRFNIVRCLIQLDRGVEASENLEVALKYGAAPLEEAVYSEALAYEKLLANQIGDVRVRCTQVGVKVTLDGQPLAVCPGEQTRRVAPGPHQLVGTKPGFLTRTADVVVLGGKRADVDLALVPLDRAGKVVHRWPTWIPWVVFGGGLGVMGLGGALESVAAGQLDTYDRAVASTCPSGCAPKDPRYDALDQQKTAALRLDHIAIGVLATGGAAVAAGAVMLYLNRGQTTYPDAVLPVVTALPGGGGAVSFGGRF